MMVEDVTERVNVENSENIVRENECKGRSYNFLIENDGENCETNDNSMKRVCPTEMGNNEKSVDEHCEENAVALGKVTSGKTIEVRESTCGIGSLPHFLPILSRLTTSLLSHRYDTRSVITMLRRERKDVMIAPGGNENNIKGSFGESGDNELSFGEEETAASSSSSEDNASMGEQMRIEAVRGPDEDNTNETTTWVETCQEIRETTCEYIVSTEVRDERRNLQAISKLKVSTRSSKRFRTNNVRERLDFHNLIDRWKKRSFFGEDEVDRVRAASEGKVPRQCWRPPYAIGESDDWNVSQQDYRHLVDRWKRQEER